MQTISADELKKKAAEIFSHVNPADTTTATKAIDKLLAYMKENSERMDPEASAIIDKVLEGMTESARKSIPSMQPGPEKRKFQRALKRLDGTCPTAIHIITGLSSSRKDDSGLLASAQGLFLPVLQSVIDLLHDATEGPQKGASGFAKMALLFSCVNELAVAFHLAQRGYSNQAYGHIRTVFELCDKIDLFHSQPAEADKWAEGESGKSWREFTPAAVRKKLGKDAFDPIYSMFSKLGPHGTFDGVQLFTGKDAEKPAPGERAKFTIWLGGTLREDQVVQMHAFILVCLSMLLFRITDMYRTVLDPEDCEEALVGSLDAIIEFDKKHFLLWAKKTGRDTKEFEQFISDRTKLVDAWRKERAAQAEGTPRKAGG